MSAAWPCATRVSTAAVERRDAIETLAIGRVFAPAFDPHAAIDAACEQFSRARVPEIT